MSTGQLIKIARKKAGLTQKELGEKLNISYVNISQLENGQRSPGLDTVQKIAAALQIDPYSLMDFDQATVALEERMNARERVDAALGKLNDAGMEKAADAVEVIAEVPRYQASAEDD